jgi:hypothetical protein
MEHLKASKVREDVGYLSGQAMEGSETVAGAADGVKDALLEPEVLGELIVLAHGIWCDEGVQGARDAIVQAEDVPAELAAVRGRLVQANIQMYDDAVAVFGSTCAHRRVEGTDQVVAEDGRGWAIEAVVE